MSLPAVNDQRDDGNKEARYERAPSESADGRAVPENSTPNREASHAVPNDPRRIDSGILRRMIVLQGDCVVPVQHWETFDRAARASAEISRTEKGCLRYDYWRHPEYADRILYFELWETMADLEAHLAAPHSVELFAIANALEGFRGEITVYETEGGHVL